jgi:hypothetical protein
VGVCAPSDMLHNCIGSKHRRYGDGSARLPGSSSSRGPRSRELGVNGLESNLAVLPKRRGRAPGRSREFRLRGPRISPASGGGALHICLMVARSCTGCRRSALASISPPCRSPYDWNGETDAGAMSAQMSATGQSSPSVVPIGAPFDPVTAPKNTIMTVLTVTITVNTKKAITSRTSKVEAQGGGSVRRDSRIEPPLVPVSSWKRPALITDQPLTRLPAVRFC